MSDAGRRPVTYSLLLTMIVYLHSGELSERTIGPYGFSARMESVYVRCVCDED